MAAYKVDAKKLARSARDAIDLIDRRITAHLPDISTGDDWLGFTWTKPTSGSEVWQAARVTDVFNPALSATGVRLGALLLSVDGLDTAPLTYGQIACILQSCGKHTARFGFTVRLRARLDCRSRSPRRRVECRSRSPRRADLANLGKVTTSSGLQAFNTSWAGVDVTDEEARRRQLRAKKYGLQCPGVAEHEGMGLRGPEKDMNQASHAMPTVEIDTGQCGEHEEVVVDLSSPGKLAGPVIGTCRTVEKDYFRLIEAPRPELIRPLPVIQEALARLKQLWGAGSGRDHEDRQKTGHLSWKYIGDQLRAVRQDLIVQHLHDPVISVEGSTFAEELYTLNARWALSEGDLGQFEQSVSMLHAVQQMAGRSRDSRSVAIEAELLGSRMLHTLLTERREQQQQMLAEAQNWHKGLENYYCRGAHTNPQLGHFMKWLQALSSAHRLGNSVKLLSLCIECPALPTIPGSSAAELLLSRFSDRIRLQLLRRLCRAFPGGLLLQTLSRQLLFEEDPQCSAWCQRSGAVFHNSMGGVAKLDSKSTLLALDELSNVSSQSSEAPKELPDDMAAPAAAPAENVTAAVRPTVSAAQGARARALARKAKKKGAQPECSD